MKSFILHVYHRDAILALAQKNHEIIGVVQSIEDETQFSFTSPQELWKIISQRNHKKFTARHREKSSE